MANPVRIYVLHHPASEAARLLTEHIYEWFRLPSLEGIPVYVRSAPERGKPTPLEIRTTPGVLNYLVPLVDAHMVRDMVWQEYLAALATVCDETHRRPAGPDAGKFAVTEGMALFPVALDGTATNLPASVSRRNFIRHRKGTGPEDPTAVEETLKHLTEALSRDLNGRLFPTQAGNKLKVFISYARADGTDTPKQIRDFIQSRTQCAAFFDENDIGYGTGFGEVLEEDVGEQARALIVIRGDNYADRPWCRWELSRYLRPRYVPLYPENPGTLNLAAAGGLDARVGVFHPVLVVDALEQARLTREIPELGQAPTLRWAPGREQLCFSMLLREVLLGARNVLAARQGAQYRSSGLEPADTPERQLWLNRMPGPLALQQILAVEGLGNQEPITLNYGGNGLPLMELRLIERMFPQIRFCAFHDLSDKLPERMRKACAHRDLSPPLAGKAIVISSSSSRDFSALGYLERHLRELLIYLLRPLISLGADIVYGGMPPKATASSRDDTSNITATLLGLISDERSAAPIEQSSANQPGRRVAPGRLFNPSQWPYCNRITTEDEAAWVNLCTIRRITPADAELRPCEDESLWPRERPRTARYLATTALVHALGRRQTAEGFVSPVPGNSRRRVEPAAYVLIGGKLSGFSGLMPGIFEEFFQAIRHRRPVFLLGGLGGAAEVLAQALLAPPSKRSARPAQLTKAYYIRDQENPTYRTMLEGLKEIQGSRGKPRSTRIVDAAFEDLWQVIQGAHRHPQGPTTILNNGLTPQENRDLLTTDVTTDAVHLIWQGLERLLLSDKPARKRSRA